MTNMLPNLSNFANAPDISLAEDIIEEWAAPLEISTEQHGFLAFIATYSPYLARLCALHPDVFTAFYKGEAHAFCDVLIAELYTRQTETITAEKARYYVRECKQRLSLMIALADIAGYWSLEQVTDTLSDFADAATQYALEQCYRHALPKKPTTNDVLSTGSGIIILGMGKLGGRELNYSSDIDLIALYDPEKLNFLAPPARGRFCVRLIQQLASFLQEREANGYVFRVDLRLRPDPASTGLAVALDTAIRYYENVGQNWERAAMIKARIIAGDTETGQYFLTTIQPFLWRTHLDFAAIDDILSIKRQMQAKEETHITLPSHHLKTGYGGIREIEFLAQIYQLIWGGRITELRTQATCHVLNALVEQGLMEEEENQALQTAYYLYRFVEHRLQMKLDQQTHSLPESDEDFETLAAFCHFTDTQQFKDTLLVHLSRVHRYFIRSFAESAPLGHAGKLVFTGVDHDSETLATLVRMGFATPENISTAIQQWHKGSKRCTRSKRARELLTELVPDLLDALSTTAHPNQAFKRFDEFLDALPTGVQLFSLFHSNRELLALVTGLIGNAPTLATRLSRYPQLLDLVVERNVEQLDKSSGSLKLDLTNWLTLARNEEEIYHYFCLFKLEKEFMIGVQLLQRTITLKAASRYLSLLADTMINKAVELATQQMNDRYDMAPPLHFAVIALGKLGSQSLMIGSDLDVMCVYDTSKYGNDQPLSADRYYHRLTTRVINLLSYPTKDGALYMMDTQLRPFGAQGAVAVKLQGFRDYYASSAWVVENLALLQGRIVMASRGIKPNITQALAQAQHINLPPNDIITSIQDVRKKIGMQHYSSNPWDVKYVWGGLMDLQWILKALLAQYGQTHPYPKNIWHIHTQIAWLVEVGALDKKQANMLRKAYKLFHTVLSYLRLCNNGAVQDEDMTEGFRRLLTNATSVRNYEQLRQRLLKAQSQIYQLYQDLEYM